MATSNQLPTVGMQAITDGTSNTALFSERLLSQYPYRTNGDRTKATVYASGIAGLRAIFIGTRRRPAKQRVAGRTDDEQPRLPVRPGMPVDRLEHAGDVARRHRHRDARRQPLVPRALELRPLDGPQHSTLHQSVRPVRARFHRTLWRPSANSLHPGGVNVCFADGSVHFVKSSISLQAWWGLGTRNGGEVISLGSVLIGVHTAGDLLRQGGADVSVVVCSRSPGTARRTAHVRVSGFCLSIFQNFIIDFRHVARARRIWAVRSKESFTAPRPAPKAF